MACRRPEVARRYRKGHFAVTPPQASEAAVGDLPRLAEETRKRVESAWHNHDDSGRVVISMKDAMLLVETLLPVLIQAPTP